MPERVVAPAPAKVNLRLRVLSREESGYHALESLFCALSLADEVEARRSPEPGIGLTVEGNVETGPPGSNLVVRAAERFYRELGATPAVELRLAKRIPAAAGMGGGSSDCAATLRALNALHADPFAPDALLRMGAELGSDVPFFLCGAPLALGWSRGERLLALPPLPVLPVLVAHPGVAMPTPEAFRRLAERRGGGDVPGGWSVTLGELLEWGAVSRVSMNDFEAVVFDGIPVLGEAVAAMRARGAILSRMAGSGASIFGVFPSVAERDGAEGALRALGLACWRAETLAEVPGLRVDPPERTG